MTTERELPSSTATSDVGGEPCELELRIRAVLGGVNPGLHEMEARDALMAIHELAGLCIAERPDEVGRIAPWLSEVVLTDLQSDIEQASDSTVLLGLQIVKSTLQGRETE